MITNESTEVKRIRALYNNDSFVKKTCIAKYIDNPRKVKIEEQIDKHHEHEKIIPINDEKEDEDLLSDTSLKTVFNIDEEEKIGELDNILEKPIKKLMKNYKPEINMNDKIFNRYYRSFEEAFELKKELNKDIKKNKNIDVEEII